MDTDEQSQPEEEPTDPNDRTNPGEGQAEGEHAGRLRLDDGDVARLARQIAAESDKLRRTYRGLVFPAHVWSNG